MSVDGSSDGHNGGARVQDLSPVISGEVRHLQRPTVKAALRPDHDGSYPLPALEFVPSQAVCEIKTRRLIFAASCAVLERYGAEPLAEVAFSMRGNLFCC